MALFQPPPTFDLPVRIDEETKKQEYSPIWLDWFYRLVGLFNSNGISDGTISYTEQTIVAGQTFAARNANPNRVNFVVAQNIIASQVFGG